MIQDRDPGDEHQGRFCKYCGYPEAECACGPVQDSAYTAFRKWRSEQTRKDFLRFKSTEQP